MSPRAFMFTGLQILFVFALKVLKMMEMGEKAMALQAPWDSAQETA